MLLKKSVLIRKDQRVNFLRINLKISLLKIYEVLKVHYCIMKSVLAIIYSNSFSKCNIDQKKRVAFSQMFNHIQSQCTLDAFIKYRVGMHTYVNTYSINNTLLT